MSVEAAAAGNSGPPPTPNVGEAAGGGEAPDGEAPGAGSPPKGPKSGAVNSEPSPAVRPPESSGATTVEEPAVDKGAAAADVHASPANENLPAASHREDSADSPDIPDSEGAAPITDPNVRPVAQITPADVERSTQAAGQAPDATSPAQAPAAIELAPADRERITEDTRNIVPPSAVPAPPDGTEAGNPPAAGQQGADGGTIGSIRNALHDAGEFVGTKVTQGAVWIAKRAETADDWLRHAAGDALSAGSRKLEPLMGDTPVAVADGIIAAGNTLDEWTDNAVRDGAQRLGKRLSEEAVDPERKDLSDFARGLGAGAGATLTQAAGGDNEPAAEPAPTTITGVTLGPATEGMEEKLINANVGTFRVEAWDRDLERVGARIDTVEAAETATGRNADLMVDLQGPKVQLGQVAPVQIGERTAYSMELEPGSPLVLDGRVDEPGTAERIGITNFPELVSDRGLRVGDLLEFGGQARAKVQGVSADKIDAQIIQGGYVSGHETIRSPSNLFPTADLTPADYQFATAAIHQGANSIALSVDDPRDVTELRRQLPNLGGEGGPKVVAKIDSSTALNRLDPITQAADALLIEPGDLGREIGTPSLTQEMQENITRVARVHQKPVFVGDMLDSMRFGEQPTPADALNVAYAAQDGFRPMLSDATRLGRNPVVAAQTAHEIAEQSLAAAGGSGTGVGAKRQEDAEIIATLGPSREGLGPPARPRMDHINIARLVDAGANTFFFDGSQFSHDRTTAGQQLDAGIAAVRTASETTGRPLNSMVDLDGPRVRIGEVAGGSVRVDKGPLVLNTSMTMSDQGDARTVGVPTIADSPSLVDHVRVGDKLQLGEGSLVEVAHVGADEVYTRVLRGGTLNSRDGVRLMGDREFLAPPFTDRENGLLTIAERRDIGAVASTAPGFREVDWFMRPWRGDGEPQVVARIENNREVDQIPDIVNKFDAVIIDRNKLMQDEGVGAAKLLPAQQRVVDAANAAGKDVYLDDTLGQMALGSDRPTAAEAMDVAYGRKRGATGFILPIRTEVHEQSEWEAWDPTRAVRMLGDIADRVR